MKDVVNEEEWKDLAFFEHYQVSSFGRVRSKDYQVLVKNGFKAIHKGKIIKPSVQNSGYLIVWLRQGGKTFAKTVHRLVASAFLEKINGKTDVNHKDGNKQNNKISNLEWVNRSENIKHSYRVLLRKTNGKAVRCIETGIIYENSIIAATELHLKKGSVCAAVNGHKKTAGGYKWEKVF